MSLLVADAPLSSASRPTRQNWWTAELPLMSARSPTSTWPPSAASLAKMQSLPTTQSCATWLPAMNKLRLPMRVMPGARPGADGHAAVDGGVLAEDVAVADDDRGRLALVGEVLRRAADDRAGADVVVRAERERADADGRAGESQCPARR